MERELVILAVSEKNGDYCVAGIDIHSNEWIRPYSRNHSTKGAVPLAHITYADGSHVRLFDVVRIDFAEHCRNPMQPENFYYNESVRWIKTDKSSLDKVLEFHGTDDRSKLFFSDDRSVLENNLRADQRRESLLLVRASELSIVIEPPSEVSPNRAKKFRLNFEYNGVSYRRFAIGDTRVRRYFERKDFGTYHFAEYNFVVFSLTDKFEVNGKNYKVAAQLLGRNRR